MGRGGNRSAQAAANGKRMGRPRKEKPIVAVLDKGLAIELYSDPSTKKRWEQLRDAKDAVLRFQVEREIAHQAVGKPVQAITHQTDKPIAINVRIHRVGAKP